MAEICKKSINNFKDWFLKLLKNEYFISFYEVSFTLILSNLIIFISSGFMILEYKDGTSIFFVFSEQIAKFVEPVQIIIIILALITPAAWIICEHINGWQHLRFVLLLIAFQLITLLGSMILYVAAINKRLNNTEYANYISIFCFVLAMIVWYATLVYKRKVIDKAGNNLTSLRRQSGDGILNELELRK